MVKRKSSLGRCTSHAKKVKLNRENKSVGNRSVRLETVRNSVSRFRQNESVENRDMRLESMENDAKRVRRNETETVRDIRISSVRNRVVVNDIMGALFLSPFLFFFTTHMNVLDLILIWK